MIDLLRQMDTWLRSQDVAIDLLTVWTLAICTALLGGVNLASWWTLRGTHDRGPVGRNLKHKKRSEGLAWLALTALYGLTLAAYYLSLTYDFYTRIALRLVLVIAVLEATVTGVLFIIALRRASRRSTPITGD